MATLDIRNLDGNEIDEIIVSDDISLTEPATGGFRISSEDGECYITVLNNEIDDLIKALQKAKELWIKDVE